MSELPGWVVDADDIPDTACILRRVPNYQIDGNLPSTANFRERDDEPTTGLSVTYWQSEKDVEDVSRVEPTFGIISVVVADIRACGLLLVRMPLVGNLNHCEIFGKITKGMRKKLKASSRWVRLPDGVDPNELMPLDSFQSACLPRVSEADI